MSSTTLTLEIEIDPEDAEMIEFAARTSGCDSVAEYVAGSAVLNAMNRCKHVAENVDDGRAERARELGQDWASRQPGQAVFSVDG